jgi:hypothetical protein
MRRKRRVVVPDNAAAALELFDVGFVWNADLDL